MGRPSRWVGRLSDVSIVRTVPLYPSAVFVQWDVNSDESGSFFVDVDRAGGPSGPWESIAVQLRDAWHVLDNKFNLPPVTSAQGKEGLNLFSLSRTVYYRVTVTPPSGTANAFVSAPTPIEPGLDVRTRLLKRKILRDEATALRVFNGVPVAVLKRRRWGERCPSCYDRTINESTLEHCPACFGTSFRGGYWAPVPVRMRKEAAAVQSQMTAHGDADVKLNDFLVLDYPRVEYKDVIVDLASNDRYQVLRVSPTTLRGVVVHQKLSTSLLARDAVEYIIPSDPIAAPPLY